MRDHATNTRGLVPPPPPTVQWQIEIKLLIFQTRTKPGRLNSGWRGGDVNHLDNLSRDATMTRLSTFNIEAEFDIYLTYIFDTY